jgi:serine/threonine protein phosphatase PrpC
VLEVHAITEPGGHAVNEDTHLFQMHPTDAGGWLCCLADGQGGRAGGARAAQLACQTVMQAACRTPIETLTHTGGWGLVFQSADQSVAADPEAGFTTLVGFCICCGRIVGASCGDSAVMLLNQAGTAILTDRQVKNPPVGSRAAVFTGFATELGEWWRVLAMTDGVWKYIGWDRVASVARSYSGRAVLEALREHAQLPGSGELQDDFTAVLVGPAAEQPSRLPTSGRDEFPAARD